jgi:imidazolonepropionase-like amidohydrolase
MSTVEVLRAATVLPAQCFGPEDRGVIEVGKRADLLLLSEDPIKDIRATKSVQKVWCCGSEFSL